MADGVVDEVVQHAVDHGDVGVHLNGLGRGFGAQGDALLLRRQFVIEHGILHQLHHRETLPLRFYRAGLQSRELEQLADEFV